ncbi:hypothetical protein KAS56_05270 [candidate division WOR-3 bacterium]|nr:hypothetical protein [candidate division WOR-3 bacterium]
MGKLSFVFFLLLLLINCVQYTKYIPDPEKDIDKWISNFHQQRSFSYQYKLETKSVYTEAKGVCVICRGEHICGIWSSPDSKLYFEYIGLGDIEYSKTKNRWQELARGDESNIFGQIERLLKFDKFEYIGSEKEFLYRFKVNIPFLVPSRRKEMVGLIKISKRNYLPKMIWAGLPDSSVYWEIELYNYNKKKRIKFPVKDWKSYSINGPGFSVDYIKEIKRRLDLIDIDYRIKKRDNDVILTMPKYYNMEDIGIMLSNRILNVYGLVECKEDACKVGYLKGDINMPLFLSDKLLDQNDIKDAKIEFDAVSRPYIQISLKEKFVLPVKIAFEVDGVILGIATLDISKKMDRIKFYTDMQYYEMQILRASLLQSLPAIDCKQIVEELH